MDSSHVLLISSFLRWNKKVEIEKNICMLTSIMREQLSFL